MPVLHPFYAAASLNSTIWGILPPLPLPDCVTLVFKLSVGYSPICFHVPFSISWRQRTMQTCEQLFLRMQVARHSTNVMIYNRIFFKVILTDCYQFSFVLLRWFSKDTTPRPTDIRAWYITNFKQRCHHSFQIGLCIEEMKNSICCFRICSNFLSYLNDTLWFPLNRVSFPLFGVRTEKYLDRLMLFKLQKNVTER